MAALLSFALDGESPGLPGRWDGADGQPQLDEDVVHRCGAEAATAKCDGTELQVLHQERANHGTDALRPDRFRVRSLRLPALLSVMPFVAAAC